MVSSPSAEVYLFKAKVTNVMTSPGPADLPKQVSTADSPGIEKTMIADGEKDIAPKNVEEFLHDMRRKNGSDTLVPRKTFHLLTFPEEIEHHERHTWKNRFRHQLCNYVAMPRCGEWHFKNIYVNRESPETIEGLIKGVYGGIKFISMDKPPNEKSPRYREFIIRGFPKIWEIDELYNILGSMSDNVYSLRRMQYQGKPTDTVKLVWKSDTEDPQETCLYLKILKTLLC